MILFLPVTHEEHQQQTSEFSSFSKCLSICMITVKTLLAIFFSSLVLQIHTWMYDESDL